jgi:hypothetical protein
MFPSRSGTLFYLKDSPKELIVYYELIPSNGYYNFGRILNQTAKYSVHLK